MNSCILVMSLNIMKNGFYTLFLHTIFSHIEVGLLLIKKLIMKLFLWVIIILVRMSGLEVSKSKCLMGIIRTLTNVRNVPELKKKLISLGVLDYGGHKFTGQGRELQVFKGILMIMKARKVGNLYKLEGKTKTSIVVVVSKKASAPTCLWHQQ